MKTHKDADNSANTKKPHVHAELIKAWAENTALKFQCRFPNTILWADCTEGSPNWDKTLEYRIKPEPKPDIVRYARAIGYDYNRFDDEDNTTYWSYRRSGQDNIKATFDGETGNLKSVEML